MPHRAQYQTIRDAAGRVKYRKQPICPVTGRKLTLIGRTPAELLAQADDVERLRRRLRAGLVSREAASVELAQRTRPGESLIFADIWEEYLSRLTGSWKKKTKSNGERHVLKSLGSKSVHELTADEMRKWEAWLTTRLPAQKSRQNVWFSVRAAVARLVESQRITRFPWGDFRVRGARRGESVGAGRAATYDADDLARLLRAARELDARTAALRPHELPDLTMRVGVMNLLGLRRGEASALAWDCVRRLPSGELRVDIRYQAREGWRVVCEGKPMHARPIAPPKNGKARDAIFQGNSLLARLFAEQKQLLKDRGLYRDDGPVFPTNRGFFRARDCARPELWRRLARMAGITNPGKWVQHSARHGACTTMLAAGASPADVMNIVGHANLETMQGYIANAGRSGSRAPEVLPMMQLPPKASLVFDVPGGSVHEDVTAAYSLGGAALDVPELLNDSGPMVVGSGKSLRAVRVDEARMLAHSAGPEAVARLYHAKNLGRQVADMTLAFSQWVAMGSPVEGTAEDKYAHVPPEARDAADRCRRRAREDALRNPPPGVDFETPEMKRKRVAKACAMAYRSSANGWHRWRMNMVRELLAKGAEHARALSREALLEAYDKKAQLPQELIRELLPFLAEARAARKKKRSVDGDAGAAAAE